MRRALFGSNGAKEKKMLAADLAPTPRASSP